MPADPLLVPTANDPTTRIMQRMAQLETRIGVLERRRPPYVQVVSAQTGFFSGTFTWGGNPLNLVLGGLAQSNTLGAAVGASVSINGTFVLNVQIPAPLTSTNVALPVTTIAVPSSALVLGSNTLSIAHISAQTTFSYVTGITVESSTA